MRPDIYPLVHELPGTTLNAAAQIVGERAPQTVGWARDNIASIHEATASGAHATVYYPASGGDVIRPLVAYGASDLICVDTDGGQAFGQVLSQLERLGAHDIVEMPMDNGRRIEFTLNGQRRRVTEMVGDARQITPSSLGVDQVDVLHVYAPTGAVYIQEDEAFLRGRFGEQWSSEGARAALQDANAPKPDEYGEYKWVVQGAGERLTSANYSFVREDGFFVFNERRLPWSPPLLEIAGIKELPITRRHPLTVSTSFYPSEAQIEAMDHTGYVLHKTRVVPAEIIDLCNDAPDARQLLGDLEAANFIVLGVGPDTQEVDVQQALQKHHEHFVSTTEACATRFRELGVDQELIDQYKARALQDYDSGLRQLQTGMQAMRTVLEDMSRRTDVGHLDEAMVHAALGVTEEDDRFNGKQFVNTRYPLAHQYAYDRDMWGHPARPIIDQLIDADLSFLST